MLNFISFIWFMVSLVLTVGWQNSYYIVDLENDSEVQRRNKIEGWFQRSSVYVTVSGFAFSLIMWSSGWHSVWGIGAAISAAWGVIYLYLCNKRAVSPFQGCIVNNKFWNYILTEGVFGYLYVFTWAQLLIIPFPTLF